MTKCYGKRELSHVYLLQLSLLQRRQRLPEASSLCRYLFQYIDHQFDKYNQLIVRLTRIETMFNKLWQLIRDYIGAINRVNLCGFSAPFHYYNI